MKPKAKDIELFEYLVFHDPYTAEHSSNVTGLAMRIGEELGLCIKEMQRLYTASLLHDIGKRAIPVEILNKPGKLTDDEFEVIKTHPAHGNRLLEEAAYPEEIRRAVVQHHERIDGKGYPLGLMDEEIDPVAKIISVADVYDALTSDRPYRKAMSKGKAIRIILEDCGSAFCEKVVDAFMRVAVSF